MDCGAAAGTPAGRAVAPAAVSPKRLSDGKASGRTETGAPKIAPRVATPAYTITPNTGYHVADVLVDGASVGATRSADSRSVPGGA